MKQEGELSVVACRPMAGVSVSPTTGVSPSCASASVNTRTQIMFPTPSPFSAASSGLSSRLSIHRTSLVLRFLALVFSFISIVSLATAQSKSHGQTSSFTHHSELMYSFIVYVLVFLYSAFQLFKGICDIAHRGILISDMVSDYLSFILDQFVGYLLIASCSVGIVAVQHISRKAPLWMLTTLAVSTSFAAFLVIVICTILSGYKLCKRIIW